MPRYKKFTRSWKRTRPVTGTRSTNICRGCFTTDSMYTLNWYTGQSYPDEKLILSPIYQRFVPLEMQSALGGDYKNYILSAWLNHDFRKMLTMYQQIRIDGCYVKITPIEWDFAGTTAPMITFYNCWDRKGNANTINTYGGAGADTQAIGRKIKETCLAQNHIGKIICPGKGPIWVKTGCHARTSGEKAFIEDETEYRSDTIVNPTTLGNVDYQSWSIKKFQFFTSPDNTYTPFSPVCWITAEIPSPVLAVGTLTCKIEMKTYFTFRVPGNMQGAHKTGLILLRTEDFMPTPTGGRDLEEKRAKKIQELRKIAAKEALKKEEEPKEEEEGDDEIEDEDTKML